MDFDEHKKLQLGKEDLSSIGSWDKKIAGLCNKLNKQKNYYTTSSCAGRIVLLKGEIDKEPGKFLFRTHEKTTFNEMKKAFSEIDFSGLVEFKQSPCILHVACRTLEDAERLVNNGRLAGWKHSGIMGIKKRFMVELLSTEHIDFPIMKNSKILIDDNLLKIIISESNMRLERTWKKINRLKELI